MDSGNAPSPIMGLFLTSQNWGPETIRRPQASACCRDEGSKEAGIAGKSAQRTPETYKLLPPIISKLSPGQFLLHYKYPLNS